MCVLGRSLGDYRYSPGQWVYIWMITEILLDRQLKQIFSHRIAVYESGPCEQSLNLPYLALLWHPYGLPFAGLAVFL